MRLLLVQFCVPFCLLLGCLSSLKAQELQAYVIYTSKGKEVDFGQMTAKLVKQDVVLFGELHNNPICHWLQLEFTKAAQSNVDALVLGAEMFETDNQLLLDEFLAGTIPLKTFEREARLWPNFQTDYLPLLEHANAFDGRFVATNTPRRYAALVSKKRIAALDSLSDAAKALLPPLPYKVTINDPGYIGMREMMGLHSMGMNIDGLIEAQALKDYTMAWNIHQNLPDNGMFLHFNGSFHSEQYAGIFNYLKASERKLKVSVIASVESDTLEFKEEWKGLGDFILVVPTSMTKTH